jgi:hypothetical protein
VTRRRLAVLLTAGLAACGAPSPPPADLAIAVDPAGDGEAFIRCDTSGANPAIYDPTFDLYQLAPGTAVSGILGGAPRRTVTIHRQRPGETGVFARTSQPGQSAGFDRVAWRITVGVGQVVDQRSGAWLTADGRERGRCRLLDAAEGRQLASLFAHAALLVAGAD